MERLTNFRYFFANTEVAAKKATSKELAKYLYQWRSVVRVLRFANVACKLLSYSPPPKEQNNLDRLSRLSITKEN